MRAALDGYGEACDWQLKVAKTGAWFAGMMGRWKDPPGLADLLGEEKPVQDGDDMAAAMGAWERVTG